MIRLRRLIAATVLTLLACLIIPPASAHRGSEYDKCCDACRAKFKEHYDKKCAHLPEGKRPKCWMECAGGEVKDCYEACDDKPRL